MSCFVEHLLYRSSAHPVTGALAPAEKLWWVFDFRIECKDSGISPYSFQVVSTTWQDLEFELHSKHDKMLCDNLIALFPEVAGKTFRLSGKNPSLFDEYSNQYFSDLMNLLDDFPVNNG